MFRLVRSNDAFADTAPTYAGKNGWAVVPVYHPIFEADGNVRCSCYKGANCEHIGKHPMPRDGYDGATTDLVTIANWAVSYRDANIGVALGSASGNLIDIDLDNPTAEQIAPLFFPRTRTFGHGTRAQSHRLYITDELPDQLVITYHDMRPVGRPNKDGKVKNIIEFRAGEMSVFPGSTHASGEPIIWSNPHTEIAHVARDDLQKCARLLHAATLLAIHNKTDLRHNTACAIGGWLAREGFPLEDAVSIVRAIAIARGKGGEDDSERAVRDSYTALAEGKEVQGYSTLAKEYYSASVMEKVRESLGIKPLSRAERAIALIEISGNNAGSVVTEVGVVPFTDHWNAMLFKKEYADIVRFCVEQDEWYVWNGKYWEQDVMMRRYELAKKIRTNVLEYAATLTGNNRQLAAEWAARISMGGALDTMITEAGKIYPELKISMREWNTNPHLITLNNGTYDLEEQKLRDFCKDDMITHHSEYDLIEDGVLPLVVEMAQYSIDNDASLAELQKGFGQSVSGIAEKVLYLCVGETNTGKTTILNTQKKALGRDHATEMAPDAITRGLYRRRDLWAADLDGKRMALASETGIGDELDVATVKAMTGNTTQKANPKYKKPFDSEPKYTIFIDTNYRPKMTGSGDDEAIWERLQIIVFRKRVKFQRGEERYIPDFDEKINSRVEMGRLLAWSFAGYPMWKEQGLSETADMKQAKQEYRDEEDMIGPFVEAHLICCPDDNKAKVALSDLRGRYTQWGLGVYGGSFPKTDWAEFDRVLKKKWNIEHLAGSHRVGKDVTRVYANVKLRQSGSSPRESTEQTFQKYEE